MDSSKLLAGADRVFFDVLDKRVTKPKGEAAAKAKALRESMRSNLATERRDRVVRRVLKALRHEDVDELEAALRATKSLLLEDDGIPATFLSDAQVQLAR